MLGSTYNVQFDMVGSLRVNSIKCLKVEVYNQGSLLHISHTEKGIEYLKKHYLNEYAIYFQRVNEEETISKHRVLYIGNLSKIIYLIELKITVPFKKFIEKLESDLKENLLNYLKQSKAIIITCKFTDKDIAFSYDDLEDKYY